MIDENFYINKAPLTLKFIADNIGAEIVAPRERNSIDPASLLISDISAIGNDNSNSLIFLSNIKYTALLVNSKATACIISNGVDIDLVPDHMWILRGPNAYYSYALALNLFYAPKTNTKSKSEIHHSVKIGQYTVIEDNVTIGEGSRIGSCVFIGHGVKIGKNAVIESNVTITHSIIGDDVVIFSGARIGQDGFGFATYNGKHHKIFHIGRVLIGDDVEIGANTTIDRGSLQDTIIESHVRIDNLVQIGHNVNIGIGTIIAAQSGIAGSSKIGKFVAMGGQVGVAGHISVADKVQIAGQSGVVQDVKDEGIVLGGTPTVHIRDWHRQSIALRKLIRR